MPKHPELGYPSVVRTQGVSNRTECPLSLIDSFARLAGLSQLRHADAGHCLQYVSGFLPYASCCPRNDLHLGAAPGCHAGHGRPIRPVAAPRDPYDSPCFCDPAQRTSARIDRAGHRRDAARGDPVMKRYGRVSNGTWRQLSGRFIKRHVRALVLLCATILPSILIVNLVVFGKQVRAWMLHTSSMPVLIRLVWDGLYILSTMLIAMFVLTIIYSVGRSDARLDRRGSGSGGRHRAVVGGQHFPGVLSAPRSVQRRLRRAGGYDWVDALDAIDFDHPSAWRSL